MKIFSHTNELYSLRNVRKKGLALGVSVISIKEAFYSQKCLPCRAMFHGNALNLTVFQNKNYALLPLSHPPPPRYYHAPPSFLADFSM